MARSMFDRYGGFAKLSKVVMAFYDKVLDSDVVGDYFEDIDMGGWSTTRPSSSPRSWAGRRATAMSSCATCTPA